MKATKAETLIATTMFKYYEVIATIDGEDEVLFGSYDKSDCVYEKQAESPSLREEGYRRIRILQRLVSTSPDPEVYSITNG